jgi:phosphatidate cytidylyltransferase
VPPTGDEEQPSKRTAFFRRRQGDIQAQMQATRAEVRAQVKTRRAQFDATQDRINARTGRNLLFAVTFGLVLGLGMLFSLIFVKDAFILVASILVAFAVFELAGALRFAGRDVPRFVSLVVSVAVMPITFYFPGRGQLLSVIGAIVVVCIWRAFESLSTEHKGTRTDLLKDFGAAAFIQLYVTLLGSFAVELAAHPNGQWWTLAFLVVVVGVDTGAYATGVAWGKHKMAPTISPKKTWEGFAGSAATALIAGVLLSIFMLQQPWWFGLIFGGVLIVTATVGDLAESLIKRDLGIKDISSWLPGHGGFLDRLDSTLPSAAAAYALYLIFT